MIGGILSGIGTKSAIGITLDVGTRTPTPSVSGDSTVPEHTGVTINITNWSANRRYTVSTPIGSLVDNSNGTYSWSMPFVMSTSMYEFSIYAEAYGELPSQTSTYSVTVEDGVTHEDVAVVNNEFDTNEESSTNVTHGATSMTYTADGVYIEKPYEQTAGLADYASSTTTVIIEPKQMDITGSSSTELIVNTNESQLSAVVVDGDSSSTELVTPWAITENDSVILINADNSCDEVVLGEINTLGGPLNSTSFINSDDDTNADKHYDTDTTTFTFPKYTANFYLTEETDNYLLPSCVDDTTFTLEVQLMHESNSNASDARVSFAYVDVNDSDNNKGLYLVRGGGGNSSGDLTSTDKLLYTVDTLNNKLYIGDDEVADISELNRINIYAGYSDGMEATCVIGVKYTATIDQDEAPVAAFKGTIDSIVDKTIGVAIDNTVTTKAVTVAPITYSGTDKVFQHTTDISDLSLGEDPTSAFEVVPYELKTKVAETISELATTDAVTSIIDTVAYDGTYLTNTHATYEKIGPVIQRSIVGDEGLKVIEPLSSVMTKVPYKGDTAITWDLSTFTFSDGFE